MRSLLLLLSCTVLLSCGNRSQSPPPADATRSDAAPGTLASPAAAPTATTAAQTPGAVADTGAASMAAPAGKAPAPEAGAAAGGAGARTPGAAAPAGGQGPAPAQWSERPVSRTHPGGSATLVGVTSSSGPAGTRLVFRFAERVPDYSVSYATGAVRECGSGEDVVLPGSARLVVAFRHAAAHDDEGRVTVAERDRPAVAPDVLRMRLFCDFEGDVSWALALPRRTGFRVTELTGPPRLVLDLQPHP